MKAYPDNMTVIAVVALDNAMLHSEQYELAVFANDECRGSAKLMYVAPIDQYVAFLTIYGETTADLRFALYDAMTGDYHSVTISTVKCSELEAVATEAAKLFALYRDNIPSLDIHSVQRYFRFNDHWFYDLKDYLDNLCGSSETVAFTAALQNAVVAKYTTGQMITLEIDPEKFSGLSSYINNPIESTLTAYYKKYAWNEAVQMIESESTEE